MKKYLLLFACILSLTGARAADSSDIKYLSLWGGDGSVMSIPLKERPAFTYDVENQTITCKTSSKEITFSMTDIHK